MLKRSLWILSLVAGCGGGSVDLEDLPAELESSQCEAAVRCGGMPDDATCAASVEFDGIDVATTEAAVEAGTIKYDGDEARKCVDQFASNDCTFPGLHSQDDSPCDRMFTGTIAVGSACNIDLECEGTAFCAAFDPACDPNVACCAGTCTAGITIVPLGEACSAQQGLFCEANTFCKVGADSAVCSALGKEGDGCDALDGCEDPLYCNLHAGGEPAVCTKPPGKGADCNIDDLIPCGDAREFCDAATAKCVARLDIGQACAPGTRCVGFAACVSGTCVADPKAGETCVDRVEPLCLGTMECANGVCALPPPGASCI